MYSNPTPAQLAALQQVRREDTCLIVYLDRASGGMRILEIAPPEAMQDDPEPFVPPSPLPASQIPTEDDLRSLLRTHAGLQAQLTAVEQNMVRYFDHLLSNLPP